MQTKLSPSTDALISSAGLSAVLAGLCYTFRWIWELSEGILKNKQYPPTIVTQNFFLIKVLLMVALAGIYQLTKQARPARIGFLAALSGLLWTSVTGTAEAYGAPGAWGFYSSPGLLLFIAGSFTLGLSASKARLSSAIGYLLMVVATAHFLGSVASMLLYNVLGRTDAANATASYVANWFFMAEGACWIVSGFLLLSAHKGVEKSGLASVLTCILK
jgi:hypothetical protein